MSTYNIAWKSKHEQCNKENWQPSRGATQFAQIARKTWHVVCQCQVNRVVRQAEEAAKLQSTRQPAVLVLETQLLQKGLQRQEQIAGCWVAHF